MEIIKIKNNEYFYLNRFPYSIIKQYKNIII